MNRFLFILCILITITIVSIGNLLLICFTGNILIDNSLDQLTATSPLSHALITNILLLILFGVQHSVMAREGFKKRFQKIVPIGLQRMVYVIISSLILIAMVWFWEPIPIILWNVKTEWVQVIIYTLFFLGWLLMFIASTLTNGFELLGFRQLANFFLKKNYGPVPFNIPIVYKLVRHPLYLGFLIAFWATPIMTIGHLLFSAGMTIYIFIGIHFEEKDLVKKFGNQYEAYRSSTPKLIPSRISGV